MKLAVVVALVLVAPPAPRRVLVSVKPPAQAIELGAKQEAQARFAVSVVDGYHVQANPASDKDLIPTALVLRGGDGVSVGKVVYPPGKPFRIQGSTIDYATYEGTFEIVVGLATAPGAQPGDRTLSGSLTYQACNHNSCQPPAETAVTLPVRIVGQKR
jgi:hypothetical protein